MSTDNEIIVNAARKVIALQAACMEECLRTLKLAVQQAETKRPEPPEAEYRKDA